MIRPRSWRLGRGATATLALLACLVLSGGPALADTQLGHSGQTGHYSIGDTASSPGARCAYVGDITLYLHHFRMRAPKIYWPTSSHFPNGTVGWRIKLQGWTGHAWVTERTSSEARGLATKTTPASLATRNMNIVFPPPSHKYRLLVKIRWMTPDAETIGSVVVRIDHYFRDADHAVVSSCRTVINLA